ncbi:NAD(P)H-hydrate epimerase [Paracoccus sp. (in: a-proteobacteria)]|uniref:NAD(P)H-hydrate epimerase n=1 Tax=Paracoccus sp. TaxID=267 RepID=UPI0026E0C306|nr:NAD(P)H-hydrate epimerase [Paracoccus sp. (in: a-proteobacteria)]MDO5370990.1 NAD(P)H-hydrate epimerase [Paracoccus sp. (in: a-proteobacteria)]
MGWTQVLTTAEMRALEAAAMSRGAVTGLELMERAGAAVAGAIRLRWPRPGHAVVLCGPGNNGGDGYVVARLLAQAGWRLRVLGLDNSPGPDAAEMKRRWAAMGAILPLTVDELQRGAGGLCVDAIFGTGLTRAPEGGIAAILAHLGGDASFRERLVAVDCPSGLCLDSGAFLGAPRQPRETDLHARLTVAFDSPKPGHLLERGPACCGELVIADIGLTGLREGGGLRPARLVAVAPAFDIPDARRDGRPWAALDKGRAAHGHKFTHGHALVLAGGVSQGGAARLAARAALRAGAGLVTLAPPGAALIEHAGPPDALMRRGVDDAGALAALLQDRRIGALCLGPGCGVDRAAALLGPLLAAGRPCVLDADALTALAARGGEGLHAACVLTPHGGEFARMFPDLAGKLAGPRPVRGSRADQGPGLAEATVQDDMDAPAQASRVSLHALTERRGPLYSKLDTAREAAARSGAVVLLKGPDTVIAAPDGQARIHSAFDVPWLATAGAGDVLAGIIAGLLARGFPPLEAAATGAWLHAAAARRFGPGLIADDLPDQLPGVFRDLGP